MPQTAVLEMRLPADVVAAIRSYGKQGATDEERLRLPLAIGLFAEGAISLAKAARMAGLTRYEFAKLLKRRGLPAYDYTETMYQEDLAFVTSAQG
jgi:predicted HTH domain antitoxin